MIEVGDKVRVIGIPEGFDLSGIEVGQVGKVVLVNPFQDTGLVEVEFEGLPHYTAHIDRDYYFRGVGAGFRAIFLVEKVVEDGVEENSPWFKTSEGIEWLYKNFQETPKELQTYRHGQVFLVNGIISGYAEPYMLVSCVEVGRHTMVNLNTGRCLDMLPYTKEVTYSEVSEMFGVTNFCLVADSAEEYFKEVCND